MQGHRKGRHNSGLVRQTVGAWAVLLVVLALGLSLASYGDHRPPQEQLTLPQWRGSPAIGTASDDETSQPVMTSVGGVDDQPVAARDVTSICEMSSAAAEAGRAAAQPPKVGSEAPC